MSRLLLCAVALAASAAAKDYSADRFDANLRLEPGGNMGVTEAVVFAFHGGPFTYVFRELATTGTDGIEVTEATMDGGALPRGNGPGQVEINGTAPEKVTWHFAPTADSTHTFGLRCRVAGVIRKESSGDALIWRAIPPRHAYRIAGSSIILEYPPGVSPLGTPVVQGVSANRTERPGAVGFSTGAVGRNRQIVIRAAFPAGSLIAKAPAWQLRRQEQQARAIIAIREAVWTGLAVFAICVLLLIRVRASFRRPETIYSAGAGITPAPPSPMPPALAETLVHNESQSGATLAIATLYDLARRGLVRFEEAGRKRFGSSEFQVVVERLESDLRPHEQVLLNMLRANEAPVRMSDLPRKLASASKPYRKALREEMIVVGWLDPERQQRRERMQRTSLVLLLGGLVGALVAGLTVSGAAAAVGGLAGFIFAGLIGLILAATASPLSDEGARAAGPWRGFERFLKEIIRGHVEAGADVFERYLPYATAFNLAPAWVSHFRKHGGVPVPGWFQVPEAQEREAAFVAFMVATSASGQHGPGGTGAGGAGASGGGASGAG